MPRNHAIDAVAAAEERGALWQQRVLGYPVWPLERLRRYRAELTRGQVVEAVSVLLKAGAEAGTLRADVEPEDVLRAMGAIWNMPGGDAWAEDARRVLGLVLDGLRYRAT